MGHTMTVKTVEVEWMDTGANKRLDQPAIAGEFLTSWMRQFDSDQETFGFLGLDCRHHLQSIKVLSHGSHTQAPVDGFKLFRAALVMDARGVILFHNHPSGQLEASRDDLDLTRRLVMGAKLIGLDVHDHIITAPGRWISLRTIRPEVFGA